MTLSYFLIPSFYDKNTVKVKLENQIFERYKLELNLENSIKYNLFPKPHFYIRDAIISYNKNDIAVSSLAKIYISNKNLYSIENIKVKNLEFNQTEFSIKNQNVNFFKKLLNSNKSEHDINFDNSKLFFKDQNDDVIFFTEIKHLNFSYNENFSQELRALLQVFNTKFRINIINNLKEKKFLTKLDSHKLRLNIDNTIDFNEEDYRGILNFRLINKSKKVAYDISKKFLKFEAEDKTFDGTFDLKPFYFMSNIKLNEIDIAKILKENSILLNLLNSEILNNQNLNANLNIFSNSIKGANYLKNMKLKVFFEEGNILVKESKINWRDSIIINLEDIMLINNNDNKVIIDGVISFDFNNLIDFYKQYQVKITHRKKIKKIRINFMLDLNEKKVNLDNIKIDGSSKKNLENFITNFNAEKKDIFNKIIFKNVIKEFFRIL